MAALSEDIVVPAAPRETVEHVVRRLHDIAALLRFDAAGNADLGEIRRVADAAGIAGIALDGTAQSAGAGPETDAVRLLEGTHLLPGARYLVSDGTIAWETAVAAWDPAEQTSLRMDMGPGTPAGDGGAGGSGRAGGSADGRGASGESGIPFAGTAQATLRSADAPTRLEVQGRLRSRGRFRRLFQVSAVLCADLERWWQQAAAPTLGTGPPPVTATLAHPFAVLEAALVPCAAEGGTWRIRATAEIRGRLLARPVVALVLWGMRGRIDAAFRGTVTVFAAELSRAARGSGPPEDELRELRELRDAAHRLQEEQAARAGQDSPAGRDAPGGRAAQGSGGTEDSGTEELLERAIARRRAPEQHWDELRGQWERLSLTIRDQAALGREPAARWAAELQRQEAAGRRPWEQWLYWIRDFEQAGAWQQGRFTADVIADGLASARGTPSA